VIWLFDLLIGYSAGSTESFARHKAVVSVLARALECCINPPLDMREP
jgi:hypothetical protein